MRTIFASMIAGALLIAGHAFAAEQSDTTSHMGQFDEQRMKMHNDQMETHLKEMQALMDRLHRTKDPAERRRLLQEHRQQMNALMQNMRSSRDDMVMGMMGGGPRHGEAMPEGEQRRKYMIEKRLDMMDNAMEMMMRREEMMNH